MDTVILNTKVHKKNVSSYYRAGVGMNKEHLDD